MKAFLRENGRMLLLTLVALLAGMVIGLTIGLAIPQQEEVQTTGKIGTATVLPDTKMERITRFLGCGHERIDAIDPTGFIGYTKEELQSFYIDDVIETFSGEKVTILHTQQGYCPSHFILRMDENGTFSVYHTKEQYYTSELVQVLDYQAKKVWMDSEREELLKGIPFEALQEIDAYLEGLES